MIRHARARILLLGLAFASAALVVAGCGDPYGYCYEGNYRDPGPGCTAPALDIVVDGDGAEWTRDDLAQIPFCATGPGSTLPACQDGFVRFMQFAVDGDTLVFHLVTVGPPVTPAQGYYALIVYDYYGPQGAERFDTLGFFWDPAQIRLNDHELFGWAIEAATGPDGLELRVPLAALPFACGAFTSANVFLQAGGWQPNRGDVTYVCWDPTVPDGCAYL